MTPHQLRKACQESLNRPLASMGLIQLVSPDHKRPFPTKGWPRPEELLCCNSSGGSVWLYDAKKVLEAVNKHFGKETINVSIDDASRS